MSIIRRACVVIGMIALTGNSAHTHTPSNSPWTVATTTDTDRILDYKISPGSLLPELLEDGHDKTRNRL